MKNLKKIIPEINLSSLPKIKKVDWFHIFKNPHDIFDHKLIEERITEFEPTIQEKIKKTLNNFYLPYPVEKFHIEKKK